MDAVGDIDSNAGLLIALGSILLLGLLASLVGRRTLLPRVTLLLLFGVVIGQHGLDVIPSPLADNFDAIAQIALLMVGFLLGGKLTRQSLDGLMWTALSISLVTVLVTAILVSLGLMLIGADVVSRFCSAALLRQLLPQRSLISLRKLKRAGASRICFSRLLPLTMHGRSYFSVSAPRSPFHSMTKASTTAHSS